MKDKFKDPLKIDFIDNTKTIIKSTILLGISIPLISSLSELIGGKK